MKRIKITVLLILLCVLAGCSPKDTSLRAYCTESQQEFLDQSLEELPVALTYHHNDNILGRYETTDEEIISEILQALRETTIVSKAFSGSTDSRILEFETADGDTCLFWFDENRFHGVNVNIKFTKSVSLIFTSSGCYDHHPQSWISYPLFDMTFL